MRLLIATKNSGKLYEIRALLADMPLELESLHLFPHIPEVEEDGDTFRANAEKKAVFYARQVHCWTLADDSGLEVDGLGGLPGVYSARFAGGHGNDRANIRKLLGLLKDVPDSGRSARFVTAAALASPDGGRRYFTEGFCAGLIINEPRGENGFGYDPVFYLPEYGKTMAELPGEIKNFLSHRGRAILKMKRVLEKVIDKI
ncbi:MAG: XTP/dITP diphosphatase [Bacillota bacterium]